MPQNGTFFISRLNKVGDLGNEDIINALRDPKHINSRSSTYTITNFMEQSFKGEKYYYGKLTKFRAEGLVRVIDRITNKEKEQIEPDLIIASSPFIFIPQYSAFIFLRIWNQIDPSTFANRMREIILSYKEYFFIDCELKPVTDIASFFDRVQQFSSINELSAKVHPPNPLFGHLWEKLEKYLRKRSLEELKISESSKNKPIESSLLDLLKKIINEENLNLEDPMEVDVGDAAMLMAMDGYGDGRIEGKINNRPVVLRTNQKTVQFKHPIEGNIDDLYERAVEILERINNQRYLSHDD